MSLDSDRHRGLLIGRYQPFHLGHLQCIQHVLKKLPEVIIAIGSAQFSHTLHNPFTAGERLTMIRLAMDEAKIDASKYYAIPIRDLRIHEDREWEWRSILKRQFSPHPLRGGSLSIVRPL